MKRRSIIALVLLMMASYSMPALAQHASKQHYESYFSHADRVAIGKIIDAQKVSFYRDGEEKSCGVYMEVQVVNPMRGGNENFWIYNTHSDFLSEDKDREYLIFAFKNKYYNRDDGKGRYVLCEGLDSKLTDLSQFEYLSDSQVQRVFPLVDDTEGGEWMQIMQRRSNAAIPDSIETRIAKSDNKKVIEEMSLDQFITAFSNKDNG